jgi:hypothetical protein
MGSALYRALIVTVIMFNAGSAESASPALKIVVWKTWQTQTTWKGWKMTLAL